MSEETSGSAPAETSAESSESTESTQESKQQASASPTAKPTAAQVAEQKRRMKLKIDNEELEMDEDEVVRWAQKGRGADKKFNEAALMRKQVETFVQKLMNDDELEDLLTHPVTGRDRKRLKEFAEKVLLKELEEEMLDPKEKELRDYKKKLAKYEAEEKKKKEAEEAQKKEAERNELKENYSKVMISAIELSGLPKSEWTVNRIVGYMDRALQNGYELEAQDIADLIKRDFVRETKEAYGHLPEDQLLSIFGEDIVKKLKTADVKKVKGFQNSLDKPVVLPDAEERRKPKQKHLTKDQLRELVAKRIAE